MNKPLANNLSDSAESEAPKKQEKLMAPALNKGFAILDLIAKEPNLSFSDIRSRLDLPNSSCHHLISTLCQLGMLQKDEDRGYVLGLRLIELGSLAASQRKIEQIAMPELEALSQEVRLTCHLGVREGQRAVYLLKVEGNNNIHVNTWVGKSLSLQRSSLGKVLLAWQPQDELETLLLGLEWKQKLPNTIQNEEAFRTHLMQVRGRGYALDNEEDVENVRCVAAPIFDSQCQVVAAISAVGTVLDIATERFEPLAKRVMASASRISSYLGHSAAD